jgi:Flp pilus assembly protein TadB
MSDHEQSEQIGADDRDMGIAEQARHLRGDLSTGRMEERLEQAMSERPILAHLLDLRIVLRAVILCVIGALIAWILFGPAAAAIAIVLLFFLGWWGFAQSSYDRRRETQPIEREGSAT